ncbi:MAG: histidine phosphatase family protein, partial [Actinomycetota bacterium]
MCRGSPWSALGSPQPHDRHMGPPSNASSPAFPELGIVITHVADAGIARVGPTRPALSSPPMLLVLIRHGLTAATDGGVLGGWTPGVHLTDPGREQAERLAA